MLRKTCALAFSVTLAGWLVWHRATQGPPVEAMPSSKSGRALEIYASDFAERNPVAPLTSSKHAGAGVTVGDFPPYPSVNGLIERPAELYTVVCSGSKHMGTGLTVKDLPHSVKGLIERP